MNKVIMSAVENKNVSYISVFNNYLLSLKKELSSKTDESSLSSCMLIFQQKQLTLHRELLKWTDCDVCTLGQIKGDLNQTIEKIKDVEVAFHEAFNKINAQSEHSQVKELRVIADLFRVGKDEEGINQFQRNIENNNRDVLAHSIFDALLKMKNRSDDAGRHSFFSNIRRVAGSVLNALWKLKNKASSGAEKLPFYNKIRGVVRNVCGALWEMKNKPTLDDVRKHSFYAATPMQKALAIELEMIGVVIRALENGQEKLAQTEFIELPYRLKMQIFQKLDEYKLEQDRKHNYLTGFQGLLLSCDAKVKCCKEVQEQLTQSYAQFNDQQRFTLLQQDLKEAFEGKAKRENQLSQQIQTSRSMESKLFKSIRTTQQIVFAKLHSLQKQVVELQEEVVEKNIEISCLKSRLKAETACSNELISNEKDLLLLKKRMQDVEAEMARTKKQMKEMETGNDGEQSALKKEIENLKSEKEELVQTLCLLKEQIKEIGVENNGKQSKVEIGSEKKELDLDKEVEKLLNSAQASNFELDALLGVNTGDYDKEKIQNPEQPYEEVPVSLNGRVVKQSESKDGLQLARLLFEEEKSDDFMENEFFYVDELTLEEKFAEYVHSKCPNYQVDQAKRFIAEGKKLVEEIQNGQAAFIPPEKRKDLLASLVWYMLFYAVGKNQGFNQGTIVFRDPGYAICKFALQCQDVYPRESTHFKDRLLPTFFNGEEKTTTYGIDFPFGSKSDLPNLKPGLPGQKQTVNFCPIESKDGLHWSFFKPEDWGLSDLYQFLGHAWDYLATRPAHFFGNPNGEEDRKEHLPIEIEKDFLAIYSKATQTQNIPDDVKKFGIAGVNAILEAMLKDENCKFLKEEIEKLLSKLSKNYDNLNVQKGKESTLSESFINGRDPKPRKSESRSSEELAMLKKMDALALVKHAVNGAELKRALAALQQMSPMETLIKDPIPDIARGFFLDKNNPKSLFDKDKIFAQVNKDLTRTDFKIDDVKFENADKIYNYLGNVEPFAKMQAGKEQEILRFMTLLQQGVGADLWGQLCNWYQQQAQGVIVCECGSNDKSAVYSVSVITGQHPTIAMKKLYKLMGADESVKAFYRNEGPYTYLQGALVIDYNQKQTRVSCTISNEAKL